MKWKAIEKGLDGNRNVAWVCDELRGIVVRHCCHPTALRPYYIQYCGTNLLHTCGTFVRLADAQRVAASTYPGLLKASGIQIAEAALTREVE